jgi:hypothetical protein
MLVDLTQGFIQADLPKGGKTIDITPPQGLEEDPDVVYEVKRPIYGMPQALWQMLTQDMVAVADVGGF